MNEKKIFYHYFDGLSAETFFDISEKIIFNENNDTKIRDYLGSIVEVIENTKDENEEKAYLRLAYVLDLESFKETDFFVGVGHNFLSKLESVASSFGLGESKNLYTPSQMVQLFADIGTINDVKFNHLLYTLRQMVLSRHEKFHAKIVLDFLLSDEILKKEEFTWQEALLFVLALQTVWEYFILFSEENRQQLISNYLYKAVVVGVPLVKVFTEYFNSSINEIDFIKRYCACVLSCKNSKEKFPVNVDSDKYETLQNYLNLHVLMGETAEETRNDKFIENLYDGVQNAEFYVEILKEVNSLVGHFQTADLVNYNDFENQKIDPDVKVYDDELLQLLSWFFLEKTWSKIIEYYKKEKIRVPLEAVLRTCSYDFDLEKEETVKRFLDFTDLLHQNNLLPADQDIIIFHESDNQFHWNDEITSP